jgi:hypothetical protein
MGFTHTLLRLEAELAWHEEALKTLPGIYASGAAAAAARVRGVAPGSGATGSGH